MKQKELTNTFMMISNKKLWFIQKYFSVVRVYTKQSRKIRVYNRETHRHMFVGHNLNAITDLFVITKIYTRTGLVMLYMIYLHYMGYYSTPSSTNDYAYKSF